ncbi:MAG: hypothetical protein VB078_11920 [Clostridiaceae bacterium]|nr:hypothetical protein [Clostridiaceae bacterium]
MTEWTVVTMIVVLSELVATLVKPMLSLNTSMTKLVQRKAVSGPSEAYRQKQRGT